MSVLVADCPRCGSGRMTFDVMANVPTEEVRYGWQHVSEVFCYCRHCDRTTTFVVSQRRPEGAALFREAGQFVQQRGSINDFADIEGYVGLRDLLTQKPPEHIPPEIKAAFEEAATCISVECWNAAGAMFRMCVDLATRPMLPEGETPGLNKKTRRELGLRLPWLFDNGKLPGDLRELSNCIREDGNDAAHAGTLGKDDAEDLLDFTQALLERIYTEPKRLELAKERRAERRKPKQEE
jgi:hypothetical protein